MLDFKNLRISQRAEKLLNTLLVDPTRCHQKWGLPVRLCERGTQKRPPVRREASGLGAKEKEGPRSFLEKGGEGTKLKAQNPHDLTSKTIPGDAGLPGA